MKEIELPKELNVIHKNADESVELTTVTNPDVALYKFMRETMKSESTIAIFFEDLKKEAQKRIIATELEDILELDEVKVKSVRVEEDCYGYDPDQDKQELLERVHAETSEGNWLLVWDCMEREFYADKKEE